jgi:hypothetical protein
MCKDLLDRRESEENYDHWGIEVFLPSNPVEARACVADATTA